jgi:tRNA 2-thiouridine synthesizing protein A
LTAPHAATGLKRKKATMITSCPGPILAAKKGMADVKVGEIMEVLATDSGTEKDLPAWSKKMGHEYLGMVEEPGYLKLFVKKLK